MFTLLNARMADLACPVVVMWNSGRKYPDEKSNHGSETFGAVFTRPNAETSEATEERVSGFKPFLFAYFAV